MPYRAIWELKVDYRNTNGAEMSQFGALIVNVGADIGLVGAQLG